MRKVEVTEEVRNQRIQIGRQISAGIADNLVGGSYLAAFFVAIGLTTQDVTLINAFGSIGQIVASLMVILTFKKDPIGVKTLKFFSLFYVFLSLRYTFASYLEPSWALVLLCASNCFFSWTENMRNCAEINASPHLYGRASYTEFIGTLYAISNVFGLIFTCTLMFVKFDDDMLVTLRIFFLVSSVLRLIYVILSQRFKVPATDLAVNEKLKVDYKLLLTKKYMILSLPHIFRGLPGAVNGILQTILIQRIEMTSFQLTLLIPMTMAIRIATGYLTKLFGRKVRPAYLAGCGFFFTGLVLVGALFAKTWVGYFVIVGLQTVFSSLAGWSVIPALVFAYDNDDMAMMSSLHIFSYSICVMIGSFVFGALVDINLVLTMVICCVLYAICGFLFAIMLRKPAHPEVYHFK